MPQPMTTYSQQPTAGTGQRLLGLGIAGLGAIGQAIDYLDSKGEAVGSAVRSWFKERWQAHVSARQRRTGY